MLYTCQCSNPSFTPLPALVTMPPLPQSAITGASIFEQPPNAMLQAQAEIGQSQQIQNICTLCTPVGRKCPNNYLSPNHQEWSEPGDDWDEQKQKGKEHKEEESKDSEQK